jgi:N-acyl-L-homoserine lactone synthetase
MHKILIYLYIIHLLISSTCFEQYAAHLQEVYVVIVCVQSLVSSLSAGDCPVHRLRKNYNIERIRILCIKLEINQGCTTMHGQPVIKKVLNLRGL